MTPLVACLALLSPPGSPPASVKAQLQARYAGLARAAAQGDESVLEGLFTADFKGESPDGHPIGRRAARATFGGLMASGDTRRWTRKVLQIRRDHADVLAIVLWDCRNVWAMPGGKKSVHEVVAVVMDRWRRTPGEWRLATSRYLRFAEFSDGREISPARWRVKDRG